MPAEPDKPTAAGYASTRDWPGYFDCVAGKPPRDTLLFALKRFEGKTGLAIDLGCGEGRDAVELLKRNWEVMAIDAEPEAFKRLFAREDLTHRDHLSIQQAPFQTAVFPEALLVNASFSLPFCPPEHFDSVWSRLRRAIQPGGRFAGQLFGDHDEWAPLPDRSHFTRAQVESLLAGLEIEHFVEEDRDGETASGEKKHWHLFHIVARKPEGEPANNETT